MKKHVFISHSSKDKYIADILCAALENESIGCWIAPRDIPYGGEWSGEITNAIKASSLFIFIFSKNSNQSKQCPKEVNIADKSDIPIVCISIDDTEMNPELEYHISNTQMLFLDMKEIHSQVNRLIMSIKKIINTTETFNEQQKFFEDLISNYDDFLRKDKMKEVEIDELSKFLDRKICNFMWKTISPNNYDAGNNKDEDSLEENGDDQSYIEGKHFSLVNNKEISTLVFQVFVKPDFENFTYKYTYEQLPYFDKDIDDFHRERTYFVDPIQSEIFYGDGGPWKEFEILIFITINVKERYAMFHPGLLYKDSEKIVASGSRILHFEDLTKEEISEKTVKYVFEESEHIIIDPYNGEAVEINTCDDEENYSVELKKGHKYLFFKLANSGEETTENNHWTAEEIANWYHYVLKNNYKAILWYQRANTAESYRKMVEIFKNDPIFFDEEYAKQYEDEYRKKLADDSNELNGYKLLATIRRVD